jgi:hypothetical protein
MRLEAVFAINRILVFKFGLSVSLNDEFLSLQSNIVELVMDDFDLSISKSELLPVDETLDYSHLINNH